MSIAHWKSKEKEDSEIGLLHEDVSKFIGAWAVTKEHSNLWNIGMSLRQMNLNGENFVKIVFAFANRQQRETKQSGQTDLRYVFNQFQLWRLLNGKQSLQTRDYRSIHMPMRPCRENNRPITARSLANMVIPIIALFIVRLSTEIFLQSGNCNSKEILPMATLLEPLSLTTDSGSWARSLDSSRHYA